MAPHILYGPQSREGFWSQTATIDWCEPNYVLSHYIAEFWNSISNLALIIPQLVAFISLSKDNNVELVFRAGFLSLILVGIGSMCFHITLSRPMQMFDETSMILIVLHGFYLLYIIRSPGVNRRLLATSLTCYGFAFLALYVFLVDYPIFHHTAFGILVYVSSALAYQLKLRYKQHAEFWIIIVLQHVAFGFWLIDKHYCEVLTQFREHHVPMFLRPAFQFHAIWHLLMGLSSHIFICGNIKLRAWIKHKEIYVIKYRWLGLWITIEKLETGVVGFEEGYHEGTSSVVPAKGRKMRKSYPEIDLNQNHLND